MPAHSKLLRLLALRTRATDLGLPLRLTESLDAAMKTLQDAALLADIAAALAAASQSLDALLALQVRARVLRLLPWQTAGLNAAIKTLLDARLLADVAAALLAPAQPLDALLALRARAKSQRLPPQLTPRLDMPSRRCSLQRIWSPMHLRGRHCFTKSMWRWRRRCRYTPSSSNGWARFKCDRSPMRRGRSPRLTGYASCWQCPAFGMSFSARTWRTRWRHP